MAGPASKDNDFSSALTHLYIMKQTKLLDKGLSKKHINTCRF